MAYLPNDPILQEISEIRKDVVIANKFEDLRRVCGMHLSDPFDQQKPQDIQSAYDSSISTLRTLKTRTESVGARARSDIYKLQIDQLNRDLKSAVQEYYNIAANYARYDSEQILREQEIHHFIDEGVTDALQVSTFADYLSRGSNAHRFERERNKTLKEISQQMVELSGLFFNVNELVLQQEAAVVDCEQRAEETVNNVEGGVKNIQRSAKSAKSQRKRKRLCLLIIVLIIITIIIIIVVYLELGKLGSK